MTVSSPVRSTLDVPHVVAGAVTTGRARQFSTQGVDFHAPEIDLNALARPRTLPLPAAATPLMEVVDLLVATGERLNLDTNPTLAQALECSQLVSNYSPRLLRNCYEQLAPLFNRERIMFMIENEVGWDRLAGWVDLHPPGRGVSHVKAFPPRLIHVIAGNAPQVAATTIIRGALTRGIQLIKLPSNDLFTASAILQTMAEVAPGHPIVQSMSAVYWRGGDPAVEDVLFRPQYFDKLVAWGGSSTISNAARYIGPGFELISFDPKSSITLIGREAFADDAELHRVADLAADDAALLNQDACAASRYHFVESDLDQADRYAGALATALAKDRPMADGYVDPTPRELRDTIEAYRDLGPDYRIFGGFDGQGCVIRSDEPVDFHPEAKTVNVVRVDDLRQSIPFVNVGTQTVGIFPSARKRVLADALASAGAQRLVNVGRAYGTPPGMPHDGFYPLHRMLRWLNDEGD